MERIDFRDIVEADWCRHCQGTWFDRGEVELVIARVSATPGYNPQHVLSYGDSDHENRGHSGYGHQPRRERQEGFLEDLFD
jgi:Zn-finger nucleic acid-binding protein